MTSAQHDYSTVEAICTLYQCAIECFQSFSSACGNKSESSASMHLMYTSTLIQMMMDILGQETECIQREVACAIAALPGASDTFVYMLWAGSCK